jgi:very-short-patch-repair endonuclease
VQLAWSRRPYDVDGVERAIARLATRQCGVVGRAQLLALGVGADQIDRRKKLGRLIPIHRGVYAVGHAAVSDRGRVVAALLAAGPAAVASHRTAAYLWGLIPTLPAVVDVTTHRRARRSRPNLTIHETNRPTASTRRRGIPLTAPLRTLADLAATRPAGEVERATTEALVLRLVTPQQLEAPPAPARTEIERRMLGLVRRAGLAGPKVNHPVGPYRIDFAWLEQKVLVETDGYAVHGHRTAFETDRARDADLHSQGYVVLRFTWRQIADEPLKVAVRLAQSLTRAGQPAAAFSRRSASRPIPSSAAAAAPPA